MIGRNFYCIRSGLLYVKKETIVGAAMPGADPHSMKSSKRLTGVEISRRRLFLLACEMEEPLNAALGLAQALTLMGYGLRSIADDHGTALLVISQTMVSQLEIAKKNWRLIATEGNRKSQTKSHKTQRRALQ